MRAFVFVYCADSDNYDASSATELTAYHYSLVTVPERLHAFQIAVFERFLICTLSNLWLSLMVHIATVGFLLHSLQMGIIF